MSESKILGKIRGLLSKTVENGASESEMEQAMILARNLMAKHQIDESDIFISKDDIIENRVLSSPVGEEGANWQWDLLHAIGNGYNCTVLRSKTLEKHNYRDLYIWRIIGFNDDVAVVKSTFEILVPFVRNLYKKRYSDYKNTAERPVRYGVFVRNYIVGFTSGLYNKLEQSKRDIFRIPEEAQQYKLIVIKKDDIIQDWLKTNVSMGKEAKTNFTKDVCIEAQLSGYNDGMQAEDKKQLH